MKGSIDPLTIVLVIALIIFLLIVLGVIKPSYLIGFIGGGSP